ncbi:MAG: MFS transporter [Cyanobacteriota/Melainabacteria group bacterium]
MIFRLGDALMLKMAQPFLLDEVSKGGLAISTKEVGIIYGTVGMLFLLAGGIFGGWLVSRYGLKKCLLPTALIQNSAILLYWWLAHSKPRGEILGSLNLHGRMFEAEILLTTLVNSVEQFSYGLGVAAYTVFLLSTVKKSYKAAHYAIATALMALGLLIPGAVSGFIQESIGYELFFLVSFLASLPGIIVILFLPLTTEDHGI